MNTLKTTWEAWELGADPEPFEGHPVAFNHQGARVQGNLETAYRNAERTHLLIGTAEYVVNGYEAVEVG